MLAIALVLAVATNPLDVAIRAAIAPCRPTAKDEITVCGRRDPAERSPYLSPLPFDYAAGDPRARSVARERYDLLDYDAGGANTCSTVGPGGQYGCQFKRHKAATAQRAGARDPRGPLYDK